MLIFTFYFEICFPRYINITDVKLLHVSSQGFDLMLKVMNMGQNLLISIKSRKNTKFVPLIQHITGRCFIKRDTVLRGEFVTRILIPSSTLLKGGLKSRSSTVLRLSRRPSISN